MDQLRDALVEVVPAPPHPDPVAAVMTRRRRQQQQRLAWTAVPAVALAVGGAALVVGLLPAQQDAGTLRTGPATSSTVTAPERVPLTDDMRGLFSFDGTPAEVPAEGVLLARSGTGDEVAEMIGVEVEGMTCTVTRHDRDRLGAGCGPNSVPAGQVGFQQANASDAPGWGFFAVNVPEDTATVRLESPGEPALTASTGSPWKGRAYAVGYWPHRAAITTITALAEDGTVLIDQDPATYTP